MTREHWRAGFEQGVRDPLIAPEEAAAYPYSPPSAARSKRCGGRRWSAPANRSRRALRELAERLALDELVIVTWTYDPAPRHRSYELLAQAFGLV